MAAKAACPDCVIAGSAAWLCIICCALAFGMQTADTSNTIEALIMMVHLVAHRGGSMMLRRGCWAYDRDHMKTQIDDFAAGLADRHHHLADGQRLFATGQKPT